MLQLEPRYTNILKKVSTSLNNYSVHCYGTGLKYIYFFWLFDVLIDPILSVTHQLLCAAGQLPERRLQYAPPILVMCTAGQLDEMFVQLCGN